MAGESDASATFVNAERDTQREGRTCPLDGATLYAADALRHPRSHRLPVVDPSGVNYRRIAPAVGSSAENGLEKQVAGWRVRMGRLDGTLRNKTSSLNRSSSEGSYQNRYRCWGSKPDGRRVRNCNLERRPTAVRSGSVIVTVGRSRHLVILTVMSVWRDRLRSRRAVGKGRFSSRTIRAQDDQVGQPGHDECYREQAPGTEFMETGPHHHGSNGSRGRVRPPIEITPPRNRRERESPGIEGPGGHTTSDRLEDDCVGRRDLAPKHLSLIRQLRTHCDLIVAV